LVCASRVATRPRHRTVKRNRRGIAAAAMGNALSEEEDEPKFLEEGFNLESPEADQKINFGTAAPNCQPKHTEQTHSHKHVREEQGGDASSHQDKKQHLSEDQKSEESAPAEPKKQQLSYIQMAKLGYQELVNAIIRPPRADYKVSFPNGLLYRQCVL